MILLILATIGALTVFAALIVFLSFLAQSLSSDEPVVREREPELVPLVPACVREKRPDIWVN